MTARRSVMRAVAWWALALGAIPAIGVSTAVGWWAGGPIVSLVGFLLAMVTVLTLMAWTFDRPTDEPR